MGSGAKIEAMGGHSYDSIAGVGRIRIEMESRLDDETLNQINPKPYIG